MSIIHKWGTLIVYKGVHISTITSIESWYLFLCAAHTFVIVLMTFFAVSNSLRISLIVCILCYRTLYHVLPYRYLGFITSRNIYIFKFSDIMYSWRLSYASHSLSFLFNILILIQLFFCFKSFTFVQTVVVDLSTYKFYINACMHISPAQFFFLVPYKV